MSAIHLREHRAESVEYDESTRVEIITVRRIDEDTVSNLNITDITQGSATLNISCTLLIRVA
jgi:hypothetical protein